MANLLLTQRVYIGESVQDGTDTPIERVFFLFLPHTPRQHPIAGLGSKVLSTGLFKDRTSLAPLFKYLHRHGAVHLFVSRACAISS